MNFKHFTAAWAALLAVGMGCASAAASSRTVRDGRESTGAALYVVDGSEAQDLTQLVRGEQAWVPVALGLFGEDSCFVVRPATVEEPVTLTADGLAEQGGASACVADVDS